MKTELSVKEYLIKAKGIAFYLVAILVIVGEFALAFLFLPKMISDILDKQAVISQRKGEIESLQKAVNTLTDTSVPELKSNLEKAEVALPDEKKVSGLITGIGALATSSGVTVKSISFSPGKISTGSASLVGQVDQSSDTETAIGAGVKGVAISISVDGSSQALLGFIQKLQKVSQLVGIKTVEYSLAQSTFQGSKLTLLVYFQPTSVDVNNFKQVSPITPSETKVLEDVSGQDVFVIPTGQR